MIHKIGKLLFCFCLLTIISNKTISQTNAPVAAGKASAPTVTVNTIPAAYTAGTLVNYVRTWEPQQPITSAATVTASTSFQQVHKTTQYVDGLGRPLQNVEWQMSPSGSDIVAPVIYDAFGREQFTYLPYTSPSTNDGNFKYNPFGEQNTFFSNTYVSDQPAYSGEQVYYSQKVFEQSPLSRLQKSMPQGNSWTGSAKGVQVTYLNNNANDLVQQWTITYNPLTYANNDQTTNIPATTSTYAVGTLFKTVTLDEQGHATVEFKDVEGHTVLKKVQVGTTIPSDYSGQDINWLCTYYVYDDLNNLRFVIPPKAIPVIQPNHWVLDATTINELCFRYEYEYNYRNRLIAKKVPGAGWEYMVYDFWNRLVATQDGNMRLGNNWLRTAYDVINRPVLTLMMSYSSGASALQAYYNSTKSFTPVSVSINGIAPGTPSTITATVNINSLILPTGATSSGVLMVNTYDNYQNTQKAYSTTNNGKLTQGSNPYADALPSVASTMLQGLPTSTLTRVIENPSNLNSGVWLETATFYDDKGRPVQVQSTNYKGGLDVTTNMYSFINKPVCTYQVHNNPAASISNLRIQTNLTYDNAGRLQKVAKNLNDDANAASASTTQRIIASYNYDALGQLKEKKFGQKTAYGAAPSSTPLEDDIYSYNIRGWLKGVNWQGYGTSSTSSTVNISGQKWFGMDLSYDWGFGTNQYNGNIAGQQWVNGGDSYQRAYGYGYDNTNRILFGDFNQNFSGTWSKTDPSDGNFTIDFSTRIVAYDPNGNILAMRQNAIVVNTSQLLDNLTYLYNTNSNKLMSVSDPATEPNTNFGDFKDGNISGTDYGYDVNGNLIIDKNKYISSTATPAIDMTSGGSIIYNHLNLPYQITLQYDNTNTKPKGTITYIYDATGNKLEKRTSEAASTFNNNTATNTTTTYLGNFVYQNNALQFFSHEEGRVRVVTPTTYNNNQTYVYDYFIKDHLGNTRVVLTDELQQDIYPAATLEPAATIEGNYYTINTSDIMGNPATLTPAQQYVNNNIIPNPDPPVSTGSSSQKMYHLNGQTGDKTGLGTVLKVMAGDNVTIYGRTFWHNGAGAINNSSYNVLVSSLLTLLGNSTTIASLSKDATATALNSSTVTPGELGIWFGHNEPTPTTTPKAFINYVLFDEQFRPVPAGSGFIPVNATADQISPITITNVTVPKGGFLYVYCSNESNMDVYFDNLQVVDSRGPLLEVNNYYPFGLTMAGISDKAVKTNYAENKYKYNGKELQNKEFSDGSGLEEYDYGARMQDPQLGKWWTVDQMAAKMPVWSPYAFCYDNPIRFNDPTGTVPNPFNLLYDVLFRTFTTNTTSGFINAAASKGFFNLGNGPSIARLGRVYEDAILRSLGEDKNTQTFRASPLSRGVIPDLVGTSVLNRINPSNLNNSERIEFPQANFTDAKFKGNVNLTDAYNPEQIKTMIDVLSNQKGAYVNGEWNPNLKASDYGVAALTLITPQNGTIDAELIEYATSKNVKILQRTTEQDKDDPSRIRVGPLIIPLNIVPTEQGVSIPAKAPGQSVEVNWSKP